MRLLSSGDEVFLPELKLLGEISPDQSRVCACNIHVDRQHRSEAHDVVTPEHAFDLWQIGFVQVSAIARRLKINAANFHVQRHFLLCYDLNISNAYQLE